MRRTYLTALAMLTISALPVGGMAVSQTAPATQEAPQDALSAEDQNASPFPPGRNAALVKKVCVDCHSAKIILDMRFNEEEATRYYKNMVSADIGTEQAQKIIAYLTTTLGHDAPG